jgi:hypothetical protein
LRRFFGRVQDRPDGAFDEAVVGGKLVTDDELKAHCAAGPIASAGRGFECTGEPWACVGIEQVTGEGVFVVRKAASGSGSTISGNENSVLASISGVVRRGSGKGANLIRLGLGAELARGCKTRSCELDEEEEVSVDEDEDRE